MESFIENELSIALLFLKHLKVVELREILETGERRVLARAELLGIPGERPWVKSDHTNSGWSTTLSVHLTTYEGEDQTSHWIVRHEVGDLADANTQLTGRFPEKANMLKTEKLYPHVAVALPLSSDRIMGRLFTSLPLPIETAFPVHIHALFALTSDRQRHEHVLILFMSFIFIFSSASVMQARRQLLGRGRTFFSVGTRIYSGNTSQAHGVASLRTLRCKLQISMHSGLRGRIPGMIGRTSIRRH